MRLKLGKRNQITLPRAVLEQLRIAPGDTFLMEVYDRAIYLVPEPKDWSKALSGLGKEIWEGIDPVEYIGCERGVCQD
jgi:AbrB family looped-hinge helix DNA binding protein